MSNSSEELLLGDGRTIGDGDAVERFPARTSLSESIATSEVRPVGLRATVSERRDRLHWSSVLTGGAVALATFILLDLALVAIGATEVIVGDGAGLRDGTWWSVLAGVVAFLVGGVVAGAAEPSKKSSGILNGLGAWGIGVVLVVSFAIALSGLMFGGLGDVVNQLDQGQQTAGGATASDDVEDAARAAIAMLAAAAIAAALGGIVGNRLRSRPEHDDAVRLASDSARRLGS